MGNRAIRQRDPAAPFPRSHDYFVRRDDLYEMHINTLREHRMMFYNRSEMLQIDLGDVRRIKHRMRIAHGYACQEEILIRCLKRDPHCLLTGDVYGNLGR